MVQRLLGRGALSGLVAGLVTFAFARLVTEPVISRAVAYEAARDGATLRLSRRHLLPAAYPLPAREPDVFTRTVQTDVGLLLALLVFGAAMGALVAVVYTVALGRVGAVRPFQLALLVPAFLFVGLFATPFAKYPADPPGIGHAATIRERGSLYLLAVVCSCLCLFLAVYAGQRLHRRFGLATSVLAAGASYVVVMAVVFALEPSLGHLAYNRVHYGDHATETPQPIYGADGRLLYPGFPADLLAGFRLDAVVAQLVLWGTIALVFAPAARSLLDPAGAEAARRARFSDESRPVAV